MALVRVKVTGPGISGVLWGVLFEGNVSRPLDEVFAAPRIPRIQAYLGETAKVEIVCVECVSAPHADTCSLAPRRPAAPHPEVAAVAAPAALGDGMAAISKGPVRKR